MLCRANYPDPLSGTRSPEAVSQMYDSAGIRYVWFPVEDMNNASRKLAVAQCACILNALLEVSCRVREGENYDLKHRSEQQRWNSYGVRYLHGFIAVLRKCVACCFRTTTASTFIVTLEWVVVSPPCAHTYAFVWAWTFAKSISSSTLDAP